DAAAVGAGDEAVGGLVDGQVADLDVGQSQAELHPRRRAGQQPPYAALGGQVQRAGARVLRELVDGDVRQVESDVGKRAGGVGGQEDLTAAAAAGAAGWTGDVHLVAVGRIDQDGVEVRPVGRQVVVAELPAQAVILGDVEAAAAGEVDRIGVVVAGTLV